MRLLPEDLGTRWHIALFQQRALSINVLPDTFGSRPVGPRIGRMGRLWTRGMGLKEEVAAATLPIVSGQMMSNAFWGTGFLVLPWAWFLIGAFDPVYLIPAVPTALGVASVCCWFLPRNSLRKMHQTPVRPDEMERLRTSAAAPAALPAFHGPMAPAFFRLWNRGAQENGTDDLEEAFLALAQEVVCHESIPETAQKDLRATLQVLGDAILSLPPPHEPEMAAGSLTAADLRGDARTLLARAGGESDPVIAASLKRQAAALLERAPAAENNSLIDRRTRVLRDELRVQINALRSALPAFERAASITSVSAVDTGVFARLAESVRGVAAEAVSQAAARAELDNDVAGSPAPYATVPEQAAEPTVQRVGTR